MESLKKQDKCNIIIVIVQFGNKWTVEVKEMVFSCISFEYSGKICIDGMGYVNIKKVKCPGPIE